MSRHAWLNLPLVLVLAETAAQAQSEDRTQRWLRNCNDDSHRDRARFCELREYSLRPTSQLTVNGEMNVDFPITVRGRIGRHVETQLGSGGPLIRATTTNGGVKISER